MVGFEEVGVTTPYGFVIDNEVIKYLALSIWNGSAKLQSFKEDWNAGYYSCSVYLLDGLEFVKEVHGNGYGDSHAEFSL